MAKVLVTGGAGYIGSHACKRLFEAGHVPITYDNLSRGHKSSVKWGELIVGDLLDRARLYEAFDAFRPEAVIHFGAFAYVAESISDPSLYYRANISGSINLIDAMRKYSVDMVVFSSTCATYGQPDSLPVTEAQEQRPASPYGHSKLMVERILHDAGAAYGIRSVALRYFNAAGADPDGEIGELHDPETHAVPLAIQAALGISEGFNVLGTDHPTRDGSAIRDYVHVADLASAHIAALEYLYGGGASVSVNLGSGVGTSVLELLDTVELVTGRPILRRLMPRRPGDPAELVASIDLAARLFGWRPHLSDIREIVRTAARWHMRSLRLPETSSLPSGLPLIEANVPQTAKNGAPSGVRPMHS